MKKIIINLSILAIILIVCSISYLFINKTTDNQLVANIFVENELIVEIDLSIVMQEYEYSITVNDEEMIFLVGYNKIKVLEVCCPLEICKNQGYITLETQMIVCMPNQVVVTLTRG